MLVVSTLLAGCSFFAPTREELGGEFGKTLSVETLYVGGPNASDDNPGTASQPLASLQRAAKVAVAGDVIRIRSGTYRETVVPFNSGTAERPIVFQPDGDAEVTVSGADTADEGWALESG